MTLFYAPSQKSSKFPPTNSFRWGQKQKKRENLSSLPPPAPKSLNNGRKVGCFPYFFCVGLCAVADLDGDKAYSPPQEFRTPKRLFEANG